jgi:hypothetical protein
MKVKTTKSRIKQLIREETKLLMLEAHGLSPEDVEKVEDHIKALENAEELKTILKFLVGSNVKVDKTQDVTKMDADEDDEEDNDSEDQEDDDKE